MEQHIASDEGTLGDANANANEGENRQAPTSGGQVSLAKATHADQLGICNMLAAILYGVSSRDFAPHRRQGRRTSEARQLGMYLANICLGVDYEAIARVANRDRTTVRYSIERVEDRRENPQYDSVLVALETLIGCLQDKEVADMIENGLDIDHKSIAHVPWAD